MKRKDDDRYSRQGYNDRADYLKSVADGRGVDPFLVNMMADILGDSEDFDGLISGLDDCEYSGLLEDFRANSKD
jgi:hypothetical protein